MTDKTGFNDKQLAQLAKPLDKSRVTKREGRGGKSFDYLEVWDVEDRANQIFGYDGWSCETLDMREVWSGRRGKGDKERAAVSFVARVRVTVYAGDRVLVREGTGYGDGSGYDLGEAHELATKEAESDAEKRAFKKFGWQFGLALYDKSQEHVRAGSDDEPLDVGAAEEETDRAQLMHTRKDDPPPSPPPPPRQKEAPAAKPAAARKDPGAPKVRSFPAPRKPEDASKSRLVEVWRDWSRQVAAAIKSAPDEANARAVAAANAPLFADAKKDTGNDMTAWALGLIEKRWPAAAVDEALEIPPPTVNTVDEWDSWLDLLGAAITACPDEDAARAVIAANAQQFDVCSSIVKFDVRAWSDDKLASANFNNKRRGR